MQPSGRRLFPFAVVAVGTPLLGVLLARRRFVVITVAGASMEPAYRSGDRVLVRRLSRSGRTGIERGGVVVATWRPPSDDPPGEPAGTHGGPRRPTGEPLGARGWVIKRVVAGPGDPVPEGLGPALTAEAGKPVPRERFVVMGDNAAHSHDSRHTGYVEGGDILGVVIRRLERRW
ncbi:S26 family signal peptidase [Streptomyces atratus]|uniref:signal peptidase I n=1 Tax=Streptomyces atratus TaxID=1893 RepID=A0A2Z5J887_STRAR|nr:S26 family signal peptidase [Streptomyces atratus]AXE76510.1 S26 family signal peptidase [Streptomyces atratus]